MEMSMAKILLLMFSLTECFQFNLATKPIESCCKRIGTTLNCVRCGLTELPLSLMDSNVTRLDLSKNNIRIIPDGSFEHMTSLKMLNVSGNLLQDLNKDSFRGLHSVEQFTIGKDYVTKQWYSAEIFSSLTNVTDLRLNCLYPAHIEPGFLLHMLNIETLTTGLDDGAVLGKDFSRLENLRTLHLTGYSKFSSKFITKINLTEESLASVPQIEKLTVSYVLRNMTPNTLKPLTNLKELRLLLNNQFPTRQALIAIKKMNSATLTHLILDGSHNSKVFFVLMEDLLDSPNFENITHISLQNTHLVLFDVASALKLPHLRYISIGFNTFRAGWEELSYNMSEPVLTQLKAVNVNHLYVSIPDRKFHNIYFKQSLDLFPEPPHWINVSKDFVSEATPKLPKVSKAKGALRIAPPSLQFLYFTHIPAAVFTMELPVYIAREHNHILYYDLSGTLLPSNFSLHLGLDKLQGLNLKGCNISRMHPDQFHHFPSLVYLNLQKNNLDIFYFAKTTQTNTSRLKYLDLSYNHIKYLPTDLISSLTSLQSVSFRGNPLVEITLDIKKNIKLEMLDFSDCTLVNLTDSFMQQLDGLWSLQPNKTKVRLNLSNNRFDCSCSALAMIQWFQTTKVDIINKQFINCTYKSHSAVMMDLDFSQISKECKTPTNLVMIIVTPVGLVGLLLALVSLLHRYKWHVKWFMYKSKRKIRLAMTRYNDDILLERVQFDAFISHDHSDEDWVENQLYDNLTDGHELNLCLSRKDFSLGAPIAENIAHAIDNSRKTVLVVTPAFVKSEWCLFEMHMAIAVKGMSHIVVILKEEVPVGDMGRTLRMILQTITYIEYPEDEAGLDLFWNRLATAIQT